MSGEPTGRAAATLVLVALLGAASLPASGADAPPRFAVLQAAFFSFAQTAPTVQGADARAVLLEHASETSGPNAATQHNASDALLNSTDRTQLVVLEYQLPASTNPLAPVVGGDRFEQYYRATLLPTTIFDGTQRLVAYGPNTASTYLQLYTAARATPAGASINASGGFVLENGFLDAASTATVDLTGTRAFLQAALVEDHVASPTDGRDLRFVVRKVLGAFEFKDGHAGGRFNFTRESGWVESRLGVALWVQSDGRTEGAPPPGGNGGGDSLSNTFLLLSPAVMTGVLAVMVTVLIRREQAQRR